MDALLFDFGGTLDSDGLTWLDRFRRIYKEKGLDSADPRFDRAFYDADDRLAERHPLAGLGLEETVLLQVADTIENFSPRRLDLIGPVAQAFLADCRKHFQRNKPVLERLAKRYKLGIVSNWYGNMESVLRSEGLRELFSAVADSAVVGAIKPEPKIFEHAMAALGASAERSIMIGDSVKRDMRGAEALGMRHALLGPAPSPCCASALRLRSLPELDDALVGAAL